MHDTPKPSDRPGNPATPGPDRLLEPISGRILTYLRRRSVDPPHRLPGCKGMAKAIRRTLSPDDSIRPGPIGASALRRMGKTTRDGITSRPKARKNSRAEPILQPKGHVNAPRGSDLPVKSQKEQPRGSDVQTRGHVNAPREGLLTNAKASHSRRSTVRAASHRPI